MSRVFPLQCEAKTYAWGNLGSMSTVAQLLAAVTDSFSVDENVSYAELWMGTHSSGPSKVILPPDEQTGTTSKSLIDELRAHPEYLGEKVREKFKDSDCGLPFLFKVLSVGSPLSIQAHPNKIRAEELHRQRPDLYSDPNHKPEMALALTKFKALCGFRQFSKIVECVRDVPELRVLVGESILEELELVNVVDDSNVALQKVALKKCFTAVMTSSKETIGKQLELLVARLNDTKGKNNEGDFEMSTINELILGIHEHFAGDVGCFAVYFLNYLCMEPGQALYLGADEAHAYLSGDCIEIMACSDNVVRAGLTPKFIDVQELCNMLTYTCSSPENKLFNGDDRPESFCTVFDPPVPDFTLAKIEVPCTERKYTVPTRDSASIVLVIRGHATYDCLGGYGTRELVRGTIVFVPANEEFIIEIKGSPDLLAFQAYCQL